MRIGIDMMGVQSPGSRHRGIGRYTTDLVTTLLALDRDNEYHLYFYQEVPGGPPHWPGRARCHRLAVPFPRQTFGGALDALARDNPDRLDVLLLSSPMELWYEYRPAPRPLGGLKLAAVCYDLIPALFQEVYLGEPAKARRYYQALHRLALYDALLCISAATRDDVASHLRLPPGRAVNVGAAADDRFFRPGPGGAGSAARRALERLGITSPFVFNVGGMDHRKNVLGAVDAFALLPEGLRQSHQLVVTCRVLPGELARVREHAALRGVGGRLVVTDFVDDETLRALYQQCEAFLFASLYEGFGLPVLEAMLCGAPVIAGNNSSQVEIVGDAGLLANAHDTADVAAKLHRLLADRGLAARYRRQALRQAAKFRWEETARRALAVLAGLGAAPAGGRGRDVTKARRPRIAFFSPLPPKSSGVADYSARLLEHLGRHYAVDVFHDDGYVPHLGLGGRARCYDHRLFDRFARALPYHGVVYQMGNHPCHRYLYEALERHPGIVTLHDLSLAGFFAWLAHQRGEPELLTEAVRHHCGGRADDLVREVERLRLAGGDHVGHLVRAGVTLNRRVFDLARGVVVHTPWYLGQVEALGAEYLAKTTLVPQGANALAVDPEERRRRRQKYDLPDGALVFGSFGLLDDWKLNVEALEAFAPLAGAAPSLLFVLVGQEVDGGRARARAAGLGLGDRVRFLGRVGAAEFEELLTAVDVGVNLRRPPTFGETSGALLGLLGAGVPTVVVDVATFSSYPDGVVRKVPYDGDFVARLRGAMAELAADAGLRARLSGAALSHVQEHHRWEKVAGQYAALIDRLAGDSAWCGARPGPRRRAAQGHTTGGKE